MKKPASKQFCITPPAGSPSGRLEGVQHAPRTPSQRVQLHRALSKLGICSRTQAIDKIKSGTVCINNKPVIDPLTWVQLGLDIIICADSPIHPTKTTTTSKNSPAQNSNKIYLAMNKPRGYVTTRTDELGRKTVYDLLPPEYRTEWIFPVGRLDLDSDGLLLFTSDGVWADSLTDPKHHASKTYEVLLSNRPVPAKIDSLKSGIMLDGKPTLAAAIDHIGGCRYRIIITEGRNRQVRRMFASIGCKVKRLTRTAIGKLPLGDIESGTTIPLSAATRKLLEISVL